MQKSPAPRFPVICQVTTGNDHEPGPHALSAHGDVPSSVVETQRGHRARTAHLSARHGSMGKQGELASLVNKFLGKLQIVGNMDEKIAIVWKIDEKKALI